MSAFRAPRTSRYRRRALAGAAAVALSAGIVGCSSTTDPPAASGSTSTAPRSTTVGSTPGSMDPDERLAEAKTVAVGFFEAQAVNDWDKALSRASGPAALSIRWAQNVNTIKALNDTPYQVPSITAPNVRVQLDELEKNDEGFYVATGFVELSFRPGPVASTTTTAAPAGASSTTAAPSSPSTYAVDLTFSGEGDELKVEDYRLDDTPYPVSQLFVAPAVTAEDDDLEGEVILAHRDLDGAVQYLVDVTNSSSSPATPEKATWVPVQNGSTKPSTEVDTLLFADPAEAKGKGRSLAVLPGSFPGSAGILRLRYPAAGGTVPERTLTFDVPEFPALTPRQTNTVPSTTVPGSSTSTSSSSSTTTPSSSTTIVVTIPGGATSTTPTTSRSTTTASTAPSTTTSSSTSTTSSSTTSTTRP